MIKNLMTILGFALLLPVTAMAITERDLVGAGFPPVQAETLWDLVQQGPDGDLAIGGDEIVFDAAGIISTTGSGTDLTMNPVDQFIVASAKDANRRMIYSSSSDTALTLAFGDATAAQTQSVVMGSTDAADSDFLCLSGGGAVDIATSTRGGTICMNGNEATGAGDVLIQAGGISNSILSLEAPATNGTVSTTISAIPFTIQSASSATALTTNFGAAATAAQTFSFVSASADAADNDYLCLSGGGSCVAPTRGSYMSLYGNETAEAGDLALVTGSASGSAMFLTAGATNGAITLSTNGTTALTIASTQAATFAGDILSTDTGSVGWTAVASVAACNTTCTSGCGFGLDAATHAIVSCDNADADTCLCLGSS